MNIPLINLSNDNVFFEAYLIFLGILLSRVFSEVFTDITTLDNKYQTFKIHMYESAKDFRIKSNKKKRFYLITAIFVVISLLFIFGYQEILAIWLASSFDAIFQGVFEIWKQKKVYYFVAIGSFNFLIVAIFLTQNNLERIIILLLGFIIYVGVIFIEYVKNIFKS